MIAEHEERERDRESEEENETREGDETETSQSEPEVVILPGGVRVLRAQASPQILAEISRKQQHRMARLVRVPGGTESSQSASSDENPSHAKRLLQQRRQHAVPEKPGISLVSQQASGDQEVIATASDSGSSSEPQVVASGCRSKVSSRTTHVVPKLRSARVRAIEQKMAAQVCLSWSCIPYYLLLLKLVILFQNFFSP